MSGPVYAGSLVFAVVCSTGASVYGYLCWRVFRGSPVGHAALLLTFAMLASVVYHGLPLIIGSTSTLVESVEGLLSTALLVLVFLMIRTTRRMDPSEASGSNRPSDND